LPDLRELRRRISSVENTRKITKAMELVAAAKMRRAQAAMEASRPYADGIARVLSEMAARKLEASHPFLQARPNVRKRLLMLVTTDRGLCGGLNANATRAAMRFIDGDLSNVELVTIGRKGRDFFRRFDVAFVADSSWIGDRPPLDRILPSITVAMQEFLTDKVDEVWLLYSRYVSPIRQVPTTVRMIPPQMPEATPQSEAAESLYEFEPSPEAVLDALLPRYVESLVYHAVLENQASEQAAKMAAMKAASDNAADLIEDLTLVRNKLRQSTITRELMEIVGGAEALAQAG
jgi:F-type H+-transporting ATPase subunit gamma